LPFDDAIPAAPRSGAKLLRKAKDLANEDRARQLSHASSARLRLRRRDFTADPFHGFLRAVPSPLSPSKPLRGIVFKVLSALVFTLMSASVKLVGSDYPTGQLVFFRSAFAIAPLLVWLTWRGDLVPAIRTSHPGGHLLRSVIGTTGMFCGFAALSLLPLPDATAIGYAAPLITVILAALLLNEQVRAYRWCAVLVGFGGVLIMLSPHLGAARDVRRPRRWDDARRPLRPGGRLLLRGRHDPDPTADGHGADGRDRALLLAPVGPDRARHDRPWLEGALPRDFLVLVLIGFLGGVGQILLTQSYRYADASLVAPFEYTTMIWAIFIGFFAFGHLPDRAVIAGAAIVALAGLFVLWRERQLGLDRNHAAEAATRRPAGG
jgi:drug/metabolite transporter (DMT)-like permease